jgi:hypothetical protein
MSVLTNAKPEVKKISSDKIEFELIVTHIDDFEQMSYTTYGIRAIYSSGEVAACYPDISTSKGFVQEFLNMVRDHDVAAVHIPDLIEDFLS